MGKHDGRPWPGAQRHNPRETWLGGSHRRKNCCSYTTAGRAVMRMRRGLAARYVRMDVKARLGLI